MRAKAGTSVIVIIGLISFITAQPLTDRDYRKLFYKESSEQEQEQENSEEQLLDDHVEKLGVRPKRVVESDRKNDDLRPDWYRRFYVESNESDCDEDAAEVTPTIKGCEKRRKCKCQKTTTELPRTTSTKRVTTANPRTTTTTRKPRKTTTTAATTTEVTNISTTSTEQPSTSTTTTASPPTTTTSPLTSTTTPAPTSTTPAPTSTTPALTSTTPAPTTTTPSPITTTTPSLTTTTPGPTPTTPGPTPTSPAPTTTAPLPTTTTPPPVTTTTPSLTTTTPGPSPTSSSPTPTTPGPTPTSPAPTTTAPPPTTTTLSSTTAAPTSTASPTPAPSTPTPGPITCPYPPHHPIFSKKHPDHHLLPPGCIKTSTARAPITSEPRHPLAIAIPEFLEDGNAAQNRDILKRILRRLNRLGPKPPFPRPAHGYSNRLKKSLSYDSVQSSESLQDGNGSAEAPKRVIGVRPAVISYDRARAERAAGGRRCRRSKQEREYLRYLRRMLREAKRDMRLRRNAPC